MGRIRLIEPKVRRKEMATPIRIVIQGLVLKGELYDTLCANMIRDRLPLEVHPNEWGDEFYFAIPVDMGLDETATTKVRAGDIGYWPPGSALVIFFGPTPLSSGPDPVPAGQVNVVGRIFDDPTLLTKKKGSARIRIEKA
jgi:uncharacterized protein